MESYRIAGALVILGGLSVLLTLLLSAHFPPYYASGYLLFFLLVLLTGIIELFMGLRLIKNDKMYLRNSCKNAIKMSAVLLPLAILFYQAGWFAPILFLGVALPILGGVIGLRFNRAGPARADRGGTLDKGWVITLILLLLFLAVVALQVCC